MDALLQSVDIVVGLGFALGREPRAWLGAEQVAASTARLIRARLAARDEPRPRALGESLFQFLQFGAPHCFPGVVGDPSVGVPLTARPPLSRLVGQALVWPYPEGGVQGVAVEPLHPLVPTIALQDPGMHEALAAVDLFRVGRARERRLAGALLAGLLVGSTEPATKAS